MCVRVLGTWKQAVIEASFLNEHNTVGSNSCEKVKTIKCFGSLLTNQNPINEEMKWRVKVGNSCYY